MAKIKFVSDLPLKPRAGSRPEFWEALRANPGQWAEYPGALRSIYYAAGAHSTNGATFEACQRGGIGYVRCVKP